MLRILTYTRDRGPGWKVEVHQRPAGVWLMGYVLWPWHLCAWEWFPGWYYESLSLVEWEEVCMSFLDRTRKVADAGGSAESLEDRQAREKLPTLIEALTMRAVIDGRETNRFSLSIFINDGVWKAIVRDKVDMIACWVASKTLSGLIPTVEAALLDPDHEWRVDRYGGGEVAKRTRKKS